MKFSMSEGYLHVPTHFVTYTLVVLMIQKAAALQCAVCDSKDDRAACIQPPEELHECEPVSLGSEPQLPYKACVTITTTLSNDSSLILRVKRHCSIFDYTSECTNINNSTQRLRRCVHSCYEDGCNGRIRPKVPLAAILAMVLVVVLAAGVAAAVVFVLRRRAMYCFKSLAPRPGCIHHRLNDDKGITDSWTGNSSKASAV